MTHTRTNIRTSLLAALRTLLVALVLFNYTLAASTHEHNGAASGGELPCAICVYGSASGGAFEHSFALPITPARLPEPLFRDTDAVVTRRVGGITIRGPPLFA